MSNPYWIIKSQWLASRAAILGLVLLLGLSMSLGFGLHFTEEKMQKRMQKVSDDFGLLLGASGSEIQLFLSSVFLDTAPLPLIKGNPLKELAHTPGIAWFAPLAFGDRYKQNAIVGTTVSFLTKGRQTANLTQGRVFNATHEAVIGSHVPLSLHGQFEPVHGTIALAENEENDGHNTVVYTVVGVLQETGTPYDNAILVPVESVWKNHGLLAEFSPGIPENLSLMADTPGEDFLYTAESLPGLSALVVQPQDFAAAYKLRGAWNREGMQAVFSGEVLTKLFSLMGNVRQLLQGVAVLSQLTAVAAIVFICYFMVLLQKKSLELLGILGASRMLLGTGMAVIAVGIVLAGILSGLLAGYGLSRGVLWYIYRLTGMA